VERITGFWRFERKAGRGYSRARSLPGHLIHLVLEGGYRLRTNGRDYLVQAGDLIYYHETEEVEWLGNETDVSFYSVGFLAPRLAPPPFEKRVLTADKAIRRAFDALYAAAGDPFSDEALCAMYAALFQILTGVRRRLGEAKLGQLKGGDEWWQVEGALRSKRMFRASLDELAAIAGLGRGTLARRCVEATGVSPGKRLRMIRMEEARGLLQCSSLSVSQIADYLGYPRVHEFSRDFAGYFKRPPRAFLADR